MNLKWFRGNGTSWMGFEDGAIWAWVDFEDGSWGWSTDYTKSGDFETTRGFASADLAKSAADTAYGEWVKSLGDPLADMEPIDLDFFQTLGKHCDLYGYCPHGCVVGDERCKNCPDYIEADILSVFDVPEEDED